MKKLFFILPLLLGTLFADDHFVTEHSIKIDGVTIDYIATSGYIDIKENARFFFTAYTKKDSNPTKRPVTFCYNGGPGSSSVWLHMGAFGPKRMLSEEEGQASFPPYQWKTNNESLLDVSDLVFIDPIGTGFSEAKEDNSFYEAWNDVKSIGEFIRLYITKNERWTSPKYLAGESYGTTRSAGLAYHLHDEGIYLNGVILISVAIDFSLLPFSGNYLGDALVLPSYMATAWYYNKSNMDKTLEDVVLEAKNFALCDYYPALLQGNGLHEGEKESLLERLFTHTALSKNLLRYSNFQVNIGDFKDRFLEEEEKIVGLYDSRCNCNRPSHLEPNFGSDPSTAPMVGKFTGGFNAYLSKELGVKIDKKYEILNTNVFRAWDFSYGSPQAFSLFDKLKASLAVNPHMKIFVASGYYDLVTPFAAAEFLFQQLDPFYDCSIHNYEGGHMIYLDRTAHIQFKKDLKEFFKQ